MVVARRVQLQDEDIRAAVLQSREAPISPVCALWNAHRRANHAAAGERTPNCLGRAGRNARLGCAQPAHRHGPMDLVGGCREDGCEVGAAINRSARHEHSRS
eukprot:1342699-Prymnesium_polylepis.2